MSDATLIAQVCQAIKSYCNIEMTATAVTEYFDGGFEDLIVKVGPIISITSITDTYATQSTSDDAVLTSTAYNFNSTSGEIWRYDGAEWSKGRNRWKVVYQAGWSSGTPDDIDLAVLQWVAYLKANPTAALTSYSTGDDAETYAEVTNVPDQVKHLLAKYKRTVFKPRWYSD